MQPVCRVEHGSLAADMVDPYRRGVAKKMAVAVIARCDLPNGTLLLDR